MRQNRYHVHIGFCKRKTKPKASNLKRNIQENSNKNKDLKLPIDSAHQNHNIEKHILA